MLVEPKLVDPVPYYRACASLLLSNPLYMTIMKPTLLKAMLISTTYWMFNSTRYMHSNKSLSQVLPNSHYRYHLHPGGYGSSNNRWSVCVLNLQCPLHVSRDVSLLPASSASVWLWKSGWCWTCSWSRHSRLHSLPVNFIHPHRPLIIFVVLFGEKNYFLPCYRQGL